ncbi:Putative heterokaryon incompatibility Het-C [Septoria linicola]|uniref:Heterokaryon incompatibility Het-C n=1 Tax=Septoria linicola TaxID=215465 RepID=A0A9Q9EK10_9PEZI|nr:Putative heterokaryon incompatibility Het-C [Septoria linicola]
MALDGQSLLILAVLLICLSRPAYAFGAGNIASISSIEGVNYRHGDIMDIVLTLANARNFSSGILGRSKKFSKLDVSRLYFGNWLRDYSQAVDVASVRFVSAEAVVLVVWILGFMSFGYGTGEFEVTKERLGVYRPEEHIDNPRGYADGQDARQYDRRLRGPVNKRRELSIDPRTGMKNYVSNENAGIATSSRLCKDVLTNAIESGRRYKRSNNDEDYFEALRLLGTACHCLEDFMAHSNYAELALIELGERNIFAHVGDRTQMRIEGVRQPVFPLTTGTFGGVDFLHSVMGGFTDKMEASEIGELGDIVADCQKKDTSTLKSLLMKLPKGIFGGKESPAQQADQLTANAQAQQMQNLSISPKDPALFTRQVENLRQQIYPILEFHDQTMQTISSAISKIPILPDLLDKISEQLNIWVFSLIAPFILPIIRQVKAEVEGGSSAVLKSSKNAQHIVFNDPYATDPTHSMLSKDHFSNVLNEPCGRAAMDSVAWIVPQIVDAWDDDKIDPRRVAARIVAGVFHHPAQRGMASDAAEGRMVIFSSIENWWRGLKESERQELRGKLSREGVRASRHHKDGVHDCGHGGGRPLGMPGVGTRPPQQQQRPRPQSIRLDMPSSGTGSGSRTSSPARIQEALGRGMLGAAVGGIAGALMGNTNNSSSTTRRSVNTQHHLLDVMVLVRRRWGEEDLMYAVVVEGIMWLEDSISIITSNNTVLLRNRQDLASLIILLLVADAEAM